jgi:hypothetical protein
VLSAILRHLEGIYSFKLRYRWEVFGLAQAVAFGGRIWHSSAVAGERLPSTPDAGVAQW